MLVSHTIGLNPLASQYSQKRFGLLLAAFAGLANNEEIPEP
jgi:hypothetical protein